MYIKYSQGGKINYSYSKYIVETEEDLKVCGGKCNFGDIAYVITTAEHWIMNSKHTWYPYANSGKNPIECDCVEEMTIWNEIPEPKG